MNICIIIHQLKKNYLKSEKIFINPLDILLVGG